LSATTRLAIVSAGSQAGVSNFSEASGWCYLALLVKMAIADNIAPYVNQVYENPMQYSSVEVLDGCIFILVPDLRRFFWLFYHCLGSAAAGRYHNGQFLKHLIFQKALPSSGHAGTFP